MAERLLTKPQGRALVNEEEDPYKMIRIIGISTAVTIGIVLARTYL